jgi:hypothetical protein
MACVIELCILWKPHHFTAVAHLRETPPALPPVTGIVEFGIFRDKNRLTDGV